MSARRGALRSRSETSSSSVGPVDPDVGVVVGDARLGRRVVVARALVDDVGLARRRRRSRARSRPGRRAGACCRRRARTPPTRRTSASRGAGRRRRRGSRRARSARAWPGPGAVWKCMPRSVPRREREWLSWTNSTSTPCSAQALRAEGLDEEAALVAVDGRLEQERGRRGWWGGRCMPARQGSRGRIAAARPSKPRCP